MKNLLSEKDVNILIKESTGIQVDIFEVVDKITKIVADVISLVVIMAQKATIKKIKYRSANEIFIRNYVIGRLIVGMREENGGINDN